MTDLARTPGQTPTRGDDLSWLRKQARAHVAVTNAVTSGRLVRGPCEVCGAEKTDAHHDDYDKPLEVRWLCRLHHRAAHLQGPRRMQLDFLSVRQLREHRPETPTYIVKWVEGIREVIAVWIPIELVD